MEKRILKSVYFKKLKGLHDIKIEFSETLTAIMGVNGIGKTTVIHALACIYQPDGNGENHKFPEFFVPNTDATWTGSELTVTNTVLLDKKQQGSLDEEKEYKKNDDRWAPRYTSRPKRNVYYIGIDTCLPEIEKKTPMSRISYTSKVIEGKHAEDVVKDAAYILNKPYSSLIDNVYNKKHFSGVELRSGMKYSSLSMGTGEQRILKILNKVRSAEAFSLILIDEIDLLLHIEALHRLVNVLYGIAKYRHLQIVFTTHSTEMISLNHYVTIQYIHKIENQEKMCIYDKLTNDFLYSLTGRYAEKYTIYVEDILAKSIVREIAKHENKLSKINIVTYGSIENAFTLAASFVLSGEDLTKRVIVLDGDRYKTDNEKLDQIKYKLTGTENDIDEKRKNALSVIKQFVLPDNESPEQFLHTILIKVAKNDELKNAACAINAVKDSHEWLDDIKNRLGYFESDIVNEIFKYGYEDEELANYILEIKDWLLKKVID